ncbi:MAG TPA: DUF4010 domain-containing protein [Vicinamibacterales bacterium]|nr:DUF4010 domain-containing protein [Acidobacteriota bacterium]HQX82646.1 DUF4010 domain-containing protein [Vicinamibacterales bacterium]
MMTSALVPPFLLTMAISFLIGIGLRQYYESEQKFDTFGTVRTFVFIGMLGFVLFELPVVGAEAYLVGLVALLLFLLIYYGNKVLQKKSPGLIGVLIALLTYATGPMAIHAPRWYSVMVAVSILFVLHSKGRIRQLSDRLETGEVVTASTFLAIAGVVLPLITSASFDEGLLGQVFARLPVTPRQIWLAVVVTTAISYLGYVIQTYAYPTKGLQLTGLVGGVYSSTATVIVLARKSRVSAAAEEPAAQAILLAVSMMYVRLLALVAIFLPVAALQAAPPLLLFAALTAGGAWWLRHRGTSAERVDGHTVEAAAEPELRRNPLELSAAALFAVLFVVVSFATRVVLESYKEGGLRMMSFLVGFSDITPFVVSVLQGELGLSSSQVLQAIVIASASNNLLKTTYTYGLGSRKTTKLAAPVLIGLAVLSIAYAFLVL